MADYVVGSNQHIMPGVYLFKPVRDEVSVLRVENAAGDQVFDINTIGGWVNIGPDQPSFNQDPLVPLYVTKSSDSYIAVNIQNPSDGEFASTDIGCLNDVPYAVTDLGGLVDLGITSSNFADPDYAVYGANCAYLWAGDTEDLYLGVAKPDGKMFFFVGGLDSKDYIVATMDSNGNMGIGTQTPDAHIILDLVSTTKAFRPPCMTTAERDAIVSPQEGMVIYNTTTHVLNFRSNSAWGAV